MNSRIRCVYERAHDRFKKLTLAALAKEIFVGIENVRERTLCARMRSDSNPLHYVIGFGCFCCWHFASASASVSLPLFHSMAIATTVLSVCTDTGHQANVPRYCVFAYPLRLSCSPYVRFICVNAGFCAIVLFSTIRMRCAPKVD